MTAALQILETVQSLVVVTEDGALTLLIEGQGIAGDRAANGAGEGLDTGDRLIARQPDKCPRAANRNDGRRRAACAACAGAVVEGVVLLVERKLGVGQRGWRSG